MPMSLWQAKQKNGHNRFRNGPASAVKSKRNRVYGSIIEVKQDSMYVRFDEQLARFQKSTGIDQSSERYFLRFMNNRTTFLLEHQALERFSAEVPFQFVFPATADLRPMDYDGVDAFVKEELDWSSNDINDEQKRAIKHMLHRTAFPLPYILFGPPGTQPNAIHFRKKEHETLPFTYLQVLAKPKPSSRQFRK